MGQFSWLDCRTKKQIVDNKIRDVFVLVPKEFGGGHIVEPCYDGYGHFGGHDIYDLIADWNKPMIPEIIRKSRIGKWHCSISENEIMILDNFYHGIPLDAGYPADASRIYLEKRHIGIFMACYDEDNFRLDYPVKITYDASAVYENCDPSPSDPNQGWED